ncbi:MAG: hypothetical protein IJO65_05325 [Lachnospiraceae bacterium]|nr:hypothetical protein [Lachnospiraceae bacterium]
MAEVKKTTAKVIAKTAPVKEEAKKVEEVKAEVKEAPKAEAKPAAEKKAPAKKAAASKKEAAAKKAPAKKEAKPAAEKKAPAKKAAAKKTAVKEAVNFQFSGKSYTPDDLLKICKDVWKYDLNGKEEDFESVELYVKPEENTTYYVINGNVTGSFFI